MEVTGSSNEQLNYLASIGTHNDAHKANSNQGKFYQCVPTIQVKYNKKEKEYCVKLDSKFRGGGCLGIIMWFPMNFTLFLFQSIRTNIIHLLPIGGQPNFLIRGKSYRDLGLPLWLATF